MDIGCNIEWFVNDPKWDGGTHWMNEQFPESRSILALRPSFVKAMEFGVRKFYESMSSSLCMITFTIAIEPSLGVTRTLIRRRKLDLEGLSTDKTKALMNKTAKEFLEFAVECIEAQKLLINSDDDL